MFRQLADFRSVSWRYVLLSLYQLEIVVSLAMGGLVNCVADNELIVN